MVCTFSEPYYWQNAAVDDFILLEAGNTILQTGGAFVYKTMTCDDPNATNAIYAYTQFVGTSLIIFLLSFIAFVLVWKR